MPQNIITDQTSLSQLISKCQEYSSVALDTEFFWESTYYPKLGLIQCGLPDGSNYLIDAIELDDLKPFGKIISDPGITKILHDAIQDLTIIRQYTDAFPKNIFDTRRAAGFAGLPSTISLAKLLEETVNISLPKSETRTNWLKRPLSDKQISYATDDVKYLHDVKDQLTQIVKDKNQESWLSEEMELYNQHTLYQERTPRNQYIRVKAAKKFSSRRLAILRELAAWREIEAFETNRPRGHILTDSEMIKIVKKQPATRTELRKHDLIPMGRYKKYADEILGAIANGIKCKKSNYPQKLEGESPRGVNDKVDLAQQGFAILCGEKGIDPELMGSRVELKKLFCAGDKARPGDHRILRGWRSNFYEPLLQYIAENSIEK